VQENVEDLQESVGMLKQTKEQLVSRSSQGGGIPGEDLLTKGSNPLKGVKSNF